jgi:succinate dehydrogenase / fumarate reductase cytochrome b subunit
MAAVADSDNLLSSCSEKRVVLLYSMHQETILPAQVTQAGIASVIKQIGGFTTDHPPKTRPLAPHGKIDSVNDKRPKNLDLSTIRFPLPAITSILHRISGVFIFAGVGVVLWLLNESLSSQDGFARTLQWLDMPLVKLLVWAIVAGLLYHLVAGIKHLVMDMGIGETLSGAQSGARLVLVVSIILIALAGVWLW